MMTGAKFRADHVGSLLRPEPLLAARRRHEAGETDDARLRAAEDAAIGPAVARQLEAGIDGMTAWDMPWRSGEGVTRVPSHTWIAAGRLRPRRRLAAGEAAHVLGLTDAPV